MKIKVFTAFSGYDSQCMALDRLKEDCPDFDYELVGWSEIDKYAIQMHDAVYPQWADRNYGDISKIDWDEVPDFDFFTFSFPCTDISNAGQQKGLAKGSGTRSSLLWECCRAIETKKPKYLFMENVKALVSDKFKPFLLEFEQWVREQGYSVFHQVLNAKDYGIPQNRERLFMIGIREENAQYEFPKPFPLEIRLKDVLETNVDEKYYLSDKMLQGFIKTSECKDHGHNFSPKDEGGIAFTIRTAPGQRVDDNFIIDAKNNI
jgi:DNA (cytosine-5)-methyltransferase 1